MNETPDQVIVVNAAQRRLLVTVSVLGLALGVVFSLAGGQAVVPGCLMGLAAVLLAWRSSGLGVEATADTVKIRNLWRTYLLVWSDISAVHAERNSNVTGLVHCLVIHRHQAVPIEATGTASYSHRKVDAMKAELDGLRSWRATFPHLPLSAPCAVEHGTTQAE